MARKCFVSGKKPMSGNNVSHSKRRTRRRFLPNLQHTSLLSDALGTTVRLRMTTRGLRTVEMQGGLDAWILGTQNSRLSADARRLKRRIARAKVHRDAAAIRPA